jgi:hypothetical protein
MLNVGGGGGGHITIFKFISKIIIFLMIIKKIFLFKCMQLIDKLFSYKFFIAFSYVLLLGQTWF